LHISVCRDSGMGLYVVAMLFSSPIWFKLRVVQDALHKHRFYLAIVAI